MNQILDFLKQVLPFNQLGEDWLLEASEALDTVYFPEDSMIPLDADKNPFIYFVIKGRVVEFDSADARHPQAYFLEYAQFGAARLLDETSSAVYQAQEETILYRMPFSCFRRLLQHNKDFEQFYQQDITEKLTRLHRQLQHEASSRTMMELVRVAPLHALVELDSSTSIKTCVEKMHEFTTDACLIRHEDQVGVVAASDLLRGLALYGADLDAPVLELTSFPVISIHQDDYLFNALIKMTQYGIDRLMVRDDAGFIGVLHQKELMSLFANQSGMVMMTLNRATSMDELRDVSQQIDALVQGLSNKGVKTHYIAKLVNELQRKMQAKLWQIMDEVGRFGDATLVVMGSEGRSEQVVRTDQDNALIVDEKTAALPDFAEFCEDYTKNLIELGFPPCPGQIMVSNPIWRLSERAFELQVRSWFEQPSLETFMNISILFDAQVVRGDESRLAVLKRRLFKEVEQNKHFLSQFARSVVQFETPIGLFGRLITQADKKGHSIDLKKGGIFPIVHGVRCLAIEKGIEKTNTHWRIRELIKHKVLDEKFGIELGETLDFLNTLRLEAMLDKYTAGLEVDNSINPDTLSSLQQDLLKESLGVVNKFKKTIHYHFKLDRVL